MSRKNRPNRKSLNARKRTKDATSSPPKNANTSLKTKEKMPPGFTTDAFSNVLARLGYGTPNLLEGTEYQLTRLTNDFQLLNSLYRSNGIVRRVVDVIAEDATSNWITMTSQIDPGDLRKVENVWSTRRVKQKILQGLIWGRLYGGALGIIMIEGQEDELHTPLDFDTIMPGSFKGLQIVDRWSGAYPSQDLVDDMNDLEYGLPNSYEVTVAEGEKITVHHSRAIRFTGRNLPYWEMLAEVYWGASEVEILYEALKMFDNTVYNIASLVFNANLKVLQMSDLAELLAIGDDKSQKEFYNTVQAQNWLQSNMGMMLLNKDDNFTTHQYSFSGIGDVAKVFMNYASAVTMIPMTKLFGESPAGMNATGESDMQNYYEVIQQYQETHVAPVVDKLLPIMFMSELGAIPDDYDYTFNPVREPDDKEVADLVDKKGTLIDTLFTSGILSQKQALQELRLLGKPLGMFTTVTDEDIEQADDSTDMGELMPNDELGYNPLANYLPSNRAPSIPNNSNLTRTTDSSPRWSVNYLLNSIKRLKFWT